MVATQGRTANVEALLSSSLGGKMRKQRELENRPWPPRFPWSIYRFVGETSGQILGRMEEVDWSRSFLRAIYLKFLFCCHLLNIRFL
jgi:hypothetical protein